MPDRPIPPDAYDPKLIVNVRGERSGDNILVSLWKHDRWSLPVFVLIVVAFLAIGYWKAQYYFDLEKQNKAIAEQCKPFAEMAYKDIPAKCIVYWSQR